MGSELINTQDYANLLKDNPALENGGGTVEEMAEYLAGDVRNCREFAEVYGGNFYFGECGCCATETVSMRPYFWNNGKKYDGENQAKHLAAALVEMG